MMQSAALLAGAAGLFMFIVGVKRRYRLSDEVEIDAEAPPRRSGGDAREAAER